MRGTLICTLLLALLVVLEARPAPTLQTRDLHKHRDIDSELAELQRAIAAKNSGKPVSADVLKKLLRIKRGVSICKFCMIYQQSV